MEFSPYLQALQQLPGGIRKEKYRSLMTISQLKAQEWINRKTLFHSIAPDKKPNTIVKFLRRKFRKPTHHASLKISASMKLPEPLLPLVEIEIGRFSELPDVIIAGLLSDDYAIVYRALKAKWFFKKIGTDGHPNVQYFTDYFFHHTSLRTRSRVIKALATNLTDPKVAEEFYASISTFQGFYHARPLLKICGGSFIWDCINNQKVRLTLKEMAFIYLKNPLFIIKYLHRLFDDIFRFENSFRSSYQYIVEAKETLRKFLPKLVKKHPTDYSELVKRSDDLRILLKRYKTCIFVRKQRLALFENPQKFLPTLSLKIVTSALSRNEFKKMIQKLFPKNPLDFKFMEVYALLNFIPEDERFPLIFDAFGNHYGHDMVHYLHCVWASIRYFPTKERELYARLIYDNYDSSTAKEPEVAWRCYLPFEEALTLIVIDIQNLQKNGPPQREERVRLIRQLIFACAVNDNFEAMIRVLEFIVENFANMDEWEFVQVFDEVTRLFDIEPHLERFWKHLYQFLKNSNIRTGSYASVENIWKIAVWGIKQDLLENYDPVEKIVVLTEINELHRQKPIWNIFKDNYHFEKKCLETFIDTIFLVYNEHQEKNTDKWKNVIVSLVSAMNDFNHRNKKNFGATVNCSEKSCNMLHGPMYVSSCLWLQNDIHKLLQDYFRKKDDFDCEELITLLKKNEPPILGAFLDPEELLSFPEAIEALKITIEPIKDNWEMYYKLCKKTINKKPTRLFLGHIKWCSELPNLFINRCFAEINKEFDKRILKMLAILLEGPAFEKVVKMLIKKIPKEIFLEKIKSYPNIIRMNHPIAVGIAESIKYVNTAFSLLSVKELYDSGYMPIISKCIAGVERRLPINVVRAFVDIYLPELDPLIKHAMRIHQNSANTIDLQRFLVHLWNHADDDVDYRSYLIENIYEAFMTRPTGRTWEMMVQCLNYLNKIGQAYLHPEESHRQVLEDWLTDVTLDPKVIKRSIRYFVNCYIMPASNDSLEGRLEFFQTLFTEMLTCYLQAPKKDQASIFTFVKTFFREFTEAVVLTMPICDRKKALINIALESFLAILRTPQHDVEFYCYLKLVHLFYEKISSRQLVDEIDKILFEFTKMSSTSCLTIVSICLYNLIKLVYSDESYLFEIIEGLIEYEKRNNTILATHLLLNIMTEVSHKNDERYRLILKSLKNHKDKFIVATVNLNRNRNM